MMRRDIIITVLIIAVCAAALVAATLLVASGQLPVKPGSGAKVASPVNAPIVQVPSPATTSVRPASVAEAEVHVARTSPERVGPRQGLSETAKINRT